MLQANLESVNRKIHTLVFLARKFAPAVIAVQGIGQRPNFRLLEDYWVGPLREREGRHGGDVAMLFHKSLGRREVEELGLGGPMGDSEMTACILAGANGAVSTLVHLYARWQRVRRLPGHVELALGEVCRHGGRLAAPPVR